MNLKICTDETVSSYIFKIVIKSYMHLLSLFKFWWDATDITDITYITNTFRKLDADWTVHTYVQSRVMFSSCSCSVVQTAHRNFALINRKYIVGF